MTDTITLTALPRRQPPLQLRLEPVMATTGLALILSLALTLPAWWLDDRLFQGDSVWLKPIRFQIALILYTLTLAWYAHWLPPGFTQRPLVRLSLWAAAGAVTLEMAWIAGAAMFATASHYNGQGLMAAIYPVMGVVAIQLTSISLIFGVGMWRNRATGQGPGLHPAVHLALALGLVLTFALTLIAVVPLAGGTGHLVGTPLIGAQVPVLGWSREVGDLRVAHFLATHALHALPIAGLTAAAVLPRDLAVRAVWVAGALFAALTLALLAQALSGQPLLPLGLD